MTSFESGLHVLQVVDQKLDDHTYDSIIDIGCDEGQWLLAAEHVWRGLVRQLVGVDMKQPQDVIENSPLIDYIQHDMRDPVALMRKLQSIARTSRFGFDLAICVEVAEHLHLTFAEPLISILCVLSDTILFSAATPGQGPYGEEDNAGMHHNEQPHSYWEELFTKYGFDYHSIFNELNSPEHFNNIDPWYRMNCGLYIRR